MTPHRHYQLKVLEKEDRPLEPNMAGDERPLNTCLERYLLDVCYIKAEDVACWKQVPDYDVWKFLLKDGRTFEVTGQALDFWQKTAID